VKYVKYAEYVPNMQNMSTLFAVCTFPLSVWTSPFPMQNLQQNMQNIHLLPKNMPNNKKIQKYQKYVVSNPAWSQFMGQV
jgi:hypothetical protein